MYILPKVQDTDSIPRPLVCIYYPRYKTQILYHGLWFVYTTRGTRHRYYTTASGLYTPSQVQDTDSIPRPLVCIYYPRYKTQILYHGLWFVYTTRGTRHRYYTTASGLYTPSQVQDTDSIPRPLVCIHHPRYKTQIVYHDLWFVYTTPGSRHRYYTTASGLYTPSQVQDTDSIPRPLVCIHQPRYNTQIVYHDLWFVYTTPGTIYRYYTMTSGLYTLPEVQDRDTIPRHLVCIHHPRYKTQIVYHGLWFVYTTRGTRHR